LEVWWKIPVLHVVNTVFIRCFVTRDDYRQMCSCATLHILVSASLRKKATRYEWLLYIVK